MAGGRRRRWSAATTSCSCSARSSTAHVARSGPCLVTIFGQAGVGKSQAPRSELASELADQDGNVEILVGRSPAYGTSTRMPPSRRSSGPFRDPRDRGAGGRTRAPSRGDRRAGREPGGAEVARTVRPHRAPARGRSRGPTAPRTRPAGTAGPDLRSGALDPGIVVTPRPIVIAIEDIHWADEGTLDLIEHLAGWSRGSDPARLPRARRTARPPSGLGWWTAKCDDDLSRSVAARGRPRARRRPDRRRSGRRLARTQRSPTSREGIPYSRRKWSTGCARRTAPRQGVAPRQRSCGAGRTARRPRGGSATAASGGVGDRAELLGAHRRRAPGRRRRRRALWPSSSRATCSLPSTVSRLEGEREFAFKHALVRDVAYETLPRAVARPAATTRSHASSRSAGGANPEAVAALLAEHHNRAAELGATSRASRPRSSPSPARSAAAEASSSAGDVAARSIRTPRRCLQYRAALEHPGPSIPKRGLRSRRLWRHAFRVGHVDDAIASWESALAYQAAGCSETANRRAPPQNRLGALAQGRREASIAHFQEGIDLLKDGEPCRELIELYEEAASLYVETGDNMLAIYAAEKAQRLAKPSASRLRPPHPPHLRPGLRPDRGLRPRSTEPRAGLDLARKPARGRRSAAFGTRTAPRDRRSRIRGGARLFRRGPAARRRSWATCPPRSSCMPRSAGSRSTPPTGPRWMSARQPRVSSPSAKVVGQFCLPFSCRGFRLATGRLGAGWSTLSAVARSRPPVGARRSPSWRLCGPGRAATIAAS